MRDRYCGETTIDSLDQDVTVVGWVHRRRDHGGVIFIDLRDREGIVQVVVAPEQKEAFALAAQKLPILTKFVVRHDFQA